MIEEPYITEMESRMVATIHLVVPRNEIRSAMELGLQELMAAVGKPEGPWFTHHFRIPRANFDFEICVPIAAAFPSVGRVVCRQLPAVRVARTVYHGPYDGLGEAWREFSTWITAEGHMAGRELFECYQKGPESSQDPYAWRTELSQSLA